jgi:hypothetical protein
VSLYLINQAIHHEDIWGSGGIAPTVFTLALDGSEWSVSCPSHFTPREIALGKEAGWAPELVSTLGSREESLAFIGNRTLAVQLIAHAMLTELPRL